MTNRDERLAFVKKEITYNRQQIYARSMSLCLALGALRRLDEADYDSVFADFDDREKTVIGLYDVPD